jgi:hypothetical protein
VIQELDDARVYSYIKTSHLVIYCLVLVGCLSVALTVMFHVPSSQEKTPNWFRFDVPWICLAILVWIPVIQRIRYRKVLVTMHLDKLHSVCSIETGAFAGRWRLHKKSPRLMSSVKVLTPFVLLMVAFIVIINLMILDRAMHPVIGFADVEKVNAVQGLCEATLLLGICVPLWSFWRYPYLVALRQKGRWLSLQYRGEL